MSHSDWTGARTLSRVRRLVVAAIAASLSLFAVTAADAGAAKRVPRAFVGAVADGPLLQDPSISFAGEMNKMVTNGVQSTRTVFNWAAAQPYETFADVPAEDLDRFRDEGGVPTDYTETDRLVTAAAKRRIVLLPVVLPAPAWAATRPGDFASPPRDADEYAAFAAALARRYGPGGAFWTEHPELAPQPLRDWQIWNEPSLKQFWSIQPFAKEYVKLLRAARTAIRNVDPRATIVLAGLPNKSWTALAQIYKAGGRGLFDVAAFHPFTATVEGVETILERDRRVMAKYRDKRKPLWVTELSWTSAKGKTSVKYGNEQTERGQAKMLTGAYTMLAKERGRLRIGRVYWYTWLSRDKQRDYPFDFAGLSRVRKKGVERKPALAAYRRVALRLQHCKAKRARADRCA
jgi:hypothetical protein